VPIKTITAIHGILRLLRLAQNCWLILSCSAMSVYVG
jgi:hypothetical protein